MEPMLGRFMNAGSLNSEAGIVMIFGGRARTRTIRSLRRQGAARVASVSRSEQTMWR
jgi:hypothetical protein